MMELILAAIGLAGFGLAGYWDLKTTEFPDWLPYSMIAAALLVRGAFAWLSSDAGIITGSVSIGAAFLALGLAMYFLKQWGDGDAWLFGALGFLFPDPSGLAYAGILPFPAAIVFNFFIAAFIYIIIYSFALSAKNPEVFHGFSRSFSKEWKGALLLIGGASAAYFIFLGAMFMQFRAVPPSPLLAALFPAIIAFIVLFSHYGMYIEKSMFKRRVHVSKLRAGDVPLGGKWRMLKPREVAALKRRGGYVWIKEGVRFAPVFFIALALTLAFGDVFSLVMGLF